jgi:hypothetical protein
MWAICRSPGDETLAKRILLSLSEADRVVLYRFYVQRQEGEAIERDSGLHTGYVQRLRSTVRGQFFRDRKGAIR